jgi:hypothetical protein
MAIDFIAHPDIALYKSRYDKNPEKYKTYYRNNYEQVLADIADKKVKDKDYYRALVLDDLWFIVYFVMGIEKANHPFVVQVCNEIQEGDDSYTLDVWAREHFKSSILTIAETIQYQLKYPDKATGIFSYVAPAAKKFLFEIKQTFENSEILQACFPDVVWSAKNIKDAPVWSLDAGLVLKRKSNRKEPSISAYGLTEGMPTGLHFDRMIFDDVVTEDIGQSIEIMEKVKTKFDSAQNLGTEGGVHRVIGTFYHYEDPLMYIKNKKDADGVPVYKCRLKPATVDGTPSGEPVLLSQERLDKLKHTKTFFAQQLCNPTPVGTQRLNPEFLKEVNNKFIPSNITKVMVIDPAGGSGKGDSWAILTVGIEATQDDIGASNIYILDACIEPMTDSAAIDQIVRMYLNGGHITSIGIEKVALSTTEIHVSNALKAKGRHISQDAGSLTILKPAGREKIRRIENALAWALNNSKIHIVQSVPNAYKERLKMEMERFPFWHDDGLDALSYVYDMIKDLHLAFNSQMFNQELPKINIAVI